MKWIPAAALASVVMLAAWSVSDLYASTEPEPMTWEETERLREGIEKHENELRDFYELVERLEQVSQESSNAGRQRVINMLQESMGRIILDLEDRVGRIHVIQQHGKEPRSTEERKEVGSNTMPGTAKKYQQSYKTGGTGGKPWLARLTQMQGIYRVCSTAREPAISKHERALPYYMEKVKEFAMLMELNIWQASALLPVESDENKKDEPRQAERTSKYE